VTEKTVMMCVFVFSSCTNKQLQRCRSPVQPHNCFCLRKLHPASDSADLPAHGLVPPKQVAVRWCAGQKRDGCCAAQFPVRYGPVDTDAVQWRWSGWTSGHFPPLHWPAAWFAATRPVLLPAVLWLAGFGHRRARNRTSASVSPIALSQHLSLRCRTR